MSDDDETTITLVGEPLEPTAREIAERTALVLAYVILVASAVLLLGGTARGLDREWYELKRDVRLWVGL